MKILILQDEFFPEAKGGAAMVVYDLAKSFLSMGHEISIITTTQNIGLVGKDNMDGINIYRLYSDNTERWRAYTSLYNRKTVSHVRRIITDIKPDIVHAHNIHTHLSYHTLKLAKNRGARVFLTAHDFMLFEYGKIRDESKSYWTKQLNENKLRYNPLRNLVIRYYLHFVDKIIAVSNSLKNALENNGIKDAVVVHNGIDIKLWDISDEEVNIFKEKHGFVGKKLVLYSGRLSAAKGGMCVIRAMTKVINEIPNAILLVVGKKNKFTDKMLESAAASRIDKNIVFAGWLEGEDLKSAYMASDVFTFPSIYPEPFGLINLEAMACKKPVVATCFGGTKEIVQDGITGYLVDPQDTDIFADRISAFLSDLALSERFGNAGYERVKESFTLKRQIMAYLGIFMGV
jgi:glycosyltransferase involved in cell wall biosynthesis